MTGMIEEGEAPTVTFNISQSLAVRDGDVLLVSSPDDVLAFDAGKALLKELQARGLGKCIVLFSNGDIRLDVLSEDAMRRHGWVRANDA